MGARRFNVALVAGAGVVFVAIKNLGEGVAAFRSVAPDAAQKAKVCGCVDKNFQIKNPPQAGIGEDKKTFDDDNGSGSKCRGRGGSAVGGVVVDRRSDGAVGVQLSEVF